MTDVTELLQRINSRMKEMAAESRGLADSLASAVNLNKSTMDSADQGQVWNLIAKLEESANSIDTVRIQMFWFRNMIAQNGEKNA